MKRQLLSSHGTPDDPRTPFYVPLQCLVQLHDTDCIIDIWCDRLEHNWAEEFLGPLLVRRLGASATMLGVVDGGHRFT